MYPPKVLRYYVAVASNCIVLPLSLPREFSLHTTSLTLKLKQKKSDLDCQICSKSPQMTFVKIEQNIFLFRMQKKGYAKLALTIEILDSGHCIIILQIACLNIQVESLYKKDLYNEVKVVIQHSSVAFFPLCCHLNKKTTFHAFLFLFLHNGHTQYEKQAKGTGHKAYKSDTLSRGLVSCNCKALD